LTHGPKAIELSRRTTVKKLGYILPVALLMLAATMRVKAQDGGCVDSPENPTAILALVGMAAVGINHLRNRFGGRK
jgi:XrtJ-associated TM-motif-TM protein